MNWKRAMLMFVAVITLTGCNLPAPGRLTPTTPLGAPTAAITVIPLTSPPGAATHPAGATQAVTAAPGSASSTPQPPAETSFTPFNATVTVEGAKFRTGPGTLFPAGSLLSQGAVLTVLGRSPGDEWVYVRSGAGGRGWIFAQLIKPEKDLKTAPGVEPGEAQVVRGRVVDASGQPVNGIQFSLVQGTGDTPSRTDATTDSTGFFYAFFPTSASGTWTVVFTAISSSSRVMDANGNCIGGKCGTAKPASMEVKLPESKVLMFTWQ
ncbi:MAG: SH3 domain-containing protein [Anaerolineaceae bacterium]|nr:SH3 domain-containing protein [Anaerolineaceae bacterium]